MTTVAVALLTLTTCASGAGPDHERAFRIVAPSVVTLTAQASYADLVKDLERSLEGEVEVRVQADARRGSYDAAIATGIVLDDAGHVATTASFASTAGPLHAILSNGKVVATKLIAFDPATDLAILELVGQRPPAAHFATDTRALRENAPLCVVAAGRSRRCLATTGRLKRISANIGAGRLHDFLFLDTEPSPGAAGGAVVNSEGEVVGMVSARVDRGGTLAMPAATLVYTAESLLGEPVSRRACLGVSVFTYVDAPGGTRGVQIDGVRPDSPAARAGIDVNDVIVAYNEVPVDDVVTFKRLVWESEPGQVVAIRFRRDGVEHLVEPRLDQTDRAATTGFVRVRIATPTLGIVTSKFSVEGRVDGESKVSRGVRIEQVHPNGPAATAGLRPGDVITAVAGTNVGDGEALSGALHRYQAGDVVNVDIVRGQQRSPIAVTVAASTKVVWLPSDHGPLSPEERAQLEQDDGTAEMPTRRQNPPLNDLRREFDRMQSLVNGPPR